MSAVLLAFVSIIIAIPQKYDQQMFQQIFGPPPANTAQNQMVNEKYPQYHYPGVMNNLQKSAMLADQPVQQNASSWDLGDDFIPFEGSVDEDFDWGLYKAIIIIFSYSLYRTNWLRNIYFCRQCPQSRQATF